MSESRKKVSIIIPVFNDGKYLDEAIQSVLRQPFQNIEIIIVDDGSTDDFTRDFLKNIRQPEIRVFFKQNEGVCLTRNFGISKATGEYILPLDADDILGESFLEEAVKILDENPSVKLVYGDFQYFGKQKGMIDLPTYSMETLLGQNIIVVTSLFRKSDFMKTRGFNPNMNEGFEDWDFWLSLLETGGDVYKLNTVALYYRIKKNSRNYSLSGEKMQRLRKQIYENHKLLYAKHFFDPLKSFEYGLLLNSREYKLGKRLLKPIRFLLKNKR